MVYKDVCLRKEHQEGEKDMSVSEEEWLWSTAWQTAVLQHKMLDLAQEKSVEKLIPLEHVV